MSTSPFLPMSSVERVTRCQGQLPWPCDNPPTYLMTARFRDSTGWSGWIPEFAMCVSCTAQRRQEVPDDAQIQLRSNDYHAAHCDWQGSGAHAQGCPEASE